jgi:hypothetical protein
MYKIPRKLWKLRLEPIKQDGEPYLTSFAYDNIREINNEDDIRKMLEIYIMGESRKK